VSQFSLSFPKKSFSLSVLLLQNTTAQPIKMSSDRWTTIPFKTSPISPEIDDDDDDDYDDTTSECLTSSSDLYDDDFDFWAYSDHRDYDSQMECCICNPEQFESAHAEDENAWMFEPYRDFRSAGRAKQRERTSHENTTHYNGYRSRMEWQATCRSDNKRKKKVLAKVAKRESQNELYVSHNVKIVEWDIHIPEELDRAFNHMDDLRRYRKFNENASTFESAGPYTEVGELFAPWAQRRIAEMRSVKESRIRRNAPRTFKPMVLQEKHEYKHRRPDKIYIGDASTTTLPTNSYDALGHELLRRVLDPGKWWVKVRLREGKPIFRAVHGYTWFGEYAWYWYRDVSGCWEIREGWGYMVGEVDVEAAPVPQEVRRCSLYEWLGEGGREIVAKDEAKVHEWRKCLDDSGNVSESDSDCGWSVVSRASSEAWSVVDIQ
jgi:hypothetical protein